MVVRLLAAALLLTAFAAGCGGSHHTAATTAPKAKAHPSIRVRLTAQSHRPRVGKPWHYEVQVTDVAGKPVAAMIHLQILFGGAPVGQIGRHRVKNGMWQETIGTDGNAPFPAQARGQPLVFQAVVTALGRTKKVDYPIRVQ